MRLLYLTSVSLHVLAAMTWVGGMLLFVSALMPTLRRLDETRRLAVLQDFGPRFARVSWVCFTVLVPTGLFNLWARGVRPGDLIRAEWHSTTFGQLVMLKLVLVAAAIGLSVWHTRAVHQCRTRWLGRALLVVGVIIVFVATLLVRAA